nr:tyrosine-type recombinase/integrase [Vagococcus elongatus]
MENKYLEKEELSALLSRQRKSRGTHSYAILLEFMALTGLRIGEAISLTHENYLKADRALSDTGTLNYQFEYKKGLKGPAKTLKSHRVVDLDDRCVELLDEMITYNEEKALNDRYSNRGFIFTSRTGVLIQVNAFNFSLMRTAKKIEI